MLPPGNSARQFCYANSHYAITPITNAQFGREMVVSIKTIWVFNVCVLLVRILQVCVLLVRVLQVRVLLVRVLQVRVLLVPVLQVRVLLVRVLLVRVLQVLILQVLVLLVQSSLVLEIQYATPITGHAYKLLVEARIEVGLNAINQPISQSINFICPSFIYNNYSVF